MDELPGWGGQLVFTKMVASLSNRVVTRPLWSRGLDWDGAVSGTQAPIIHFKVTCKGTAAALRSLPPSPGDPTNGERGICQLWEVDPVCVPLKCRDILHEIWGFT